MSAIDFASELPAEVADAFVAAMVTALQELVQLEAFPTGAGCPSRCTGPDGAICATVRLSRPVPSEMRLYLGVEFAARLAARYVGEDVELSAEMVDDMAGELANVVAGQVKTMLKGTPYHFMMTAPKVRRADAFEVARPLAVVECEFGSLAVEVDLPPCPGS